MACRMWTFTGLASLRGILLIHSSGLVVLLLEQARLTDESRHRGILRQTQRPIHQPNKLFGHDPDVERSKAAEAQRSAHAEAHWQRLFFFRLSHEHGVGNFSIIVKSEDGI